MPASSQELENIRRELHVAHAAIAANEKRIDKMLDEVPDLVKAAVKDAMRDVPSLTADEHEYIKAATKVALQRFKLRQAVIEKTLGGLAWAFLVACTMLFWEAIKARLGLKETP